MSSFTFRLMVMCCICTICGDAFSQQKPLKVFLLVGQSNMQGHADVRTLAHMAMDPASKPILDQVVDSAGQAKTIDDVWISYLSPSGVNSGPLRIGFGASDKKMGPELAFGIYMQKRLGEPILIIKAAWGGKSLNTDFRPPSAGPYEFSSVTLERFEKQKKDIAQIKSDKTKATGVFYRKTIEHVKSTLANVDQIVPVYDDSVGYELAGMVWFQGWNDMVDSGTYPQRNEKNGYQLYSSVMTHFIRDFRSEIGVPKLPIVIGVLGVGGPTALYSKSQQRHRKSHQEFREAMAQPSTLNEFEGNVVAVLTENCWDLELDSLVRRESAIRDSVKRLIKTDKIDELAQLLNPDSGDDTVLQELLKLKDGRDFERSIVQRLVSAKFSNREQEVLSKGKSNAAYHYLGSAKIMTCIGQAFAEAMPLKNDK